MKHSTYYLLRITRVNFYWSVELTKCEAHTTLLLFTKMFQLCVHGICENLIITNGSKSNNDSMLPITLKDLFVNTLHNYGIWTQKCSLPLYMLGSHIWKRFKKNTFAEIVINDSLYKGVKITFRRYPLKTFVKNFIQFFL